MSAPALRPLLAELERWSAAGRTARFWLRDDDAVHPSTALDTLLALSAAHSVPVTLAVIPAETGTDLAQRLDSAPLAEVAVHGWSHKNHASVGSKKCELGGDRPAETVLGDLSRGLSKLSALHGSRFVPLLVPPWNRIDPALPARLAGIGFAGLSTFGPEPGGRGIARLNTHVDLIDWKGTRGGRPATELAGELTARLGAMRSGGRGHAGFLTHHLVHDAAAWAFLGDLLALTSAHPAAQWVSARSLLDRGRRP